MFAHAHGSRFCVCFLAADFLLFSAVATVVFHVMALCCTWASTAGLVQIMWISFHTRVDPCAPKVAPSSAVLAVTACDSANFDVLKSKQDPSCLEVWRYFQYRTASIGSSTIVM